MYTHTQSRPFPSHLFIGFSKRELQHTLEIVHYCYTSQTNEDTHHALTLAQTLLPCDKIVAAAGPLSLKASIRIKPTSSIFPILSPGWNGISTIATSGLIQSPSRG
jgi:hypothetical protein